VVAVGREHEASGHRPALEPLEIQDETRLSAREELRTSAVDRAELPASRRRLEGPLRQRTLERREGRLDPRQGGAHARRRRLRQGHRRETRGRDRRELDRGAQRRIDEIRGEHDERDRERGLSGARERVDEVSEQRVRHELRRDPDAARVAVHREGVVPGTLVAIALQALGERGWCHVLAHEEGLERISLGDAAFGAPRDEHRRDVLVVAARGVEADLAVAEASAIGERA
jgi:hypothetical protein